MFQFCLWINILRQRVLTAWLKDSRQVKSLLKKGAYCFEGEQKDLFGKKFQKKLNESKKSIRKQYSSWKNVQDTHRLNALIIMDHLSHPFDKVPIPVDLDGAIDPTKIKGSCQELDKENFTLVEEEVPGDISIQPKSKMKQTNTKGNMCVLNGRVPCMNSFTCGLVLVRPHGYLQNSWKCESSFFTKCI